MSDRGINIAMERGKLLSKFVGHRVKRNREFELGTALNVTKGYITLADEDWLRVYSPDIGPAFVVNVSELVDVRETGASSDELPPQERGAAEPDDPLFLDRGQVFQEYISEVVSDEAEVRMDTTVDEQRGFVTGLDEGWVQLTDSQTMEAVILSLDQVVAVYRTGRTINSLDPDIRAAVREYSSLIAHIASKERARM